MKTRAAQEADPRHRKELEGPRLQNGKVEWRWVYGVVLNAALGAFTGYFLFKSVMTDRSKVTGGQRLVAIPTTNQLCMARRHRLVFGGLFYDLFLLLHYDPVRKTEHENKRPLPLKTSFAA